MSRPKTTSGVQVLEAIRVLIGLKQMPPTINELRNALKLGSTRTVLRYLKELERDGMITRWPGARGLMLAGQGGRCSLCNTFIGKRETKPASDRVFDELKKTQQEKGVSA